MVSEKVECFELRQNGHPMYVGLMSVRDLRDPDKVRADMWARDNPDGYQREPTISRVLAFARYIAKGKGTSALSVLLSLRSVPKFHQKSGNFGVLEIPDNEILWIVDGQHRLAGFRHLASKNPAYDDFLLPVVLMPTAEDSGDALQTLNARYEEAKQFVIINRTQKGVRADLGERFLAKLAKREGPATIAELPSQITRGIDWIPKAIDVAEVMNSSGGQWTGKIRLPNEPRGVTTISQKSFTDSLRPVVDNRTFWDYTPKEQAEMLDRYWSAIADLCQDAFKAPNDYVIQRTTGTFVLHRIFPSVADACSDQFGRLTKDAFREVLKSMRVGMTSDYWSTSGEAGLAGTGSKSFALIASRLHDALERVHAESRKGKGRPFEL